MKLTKSFRKAIQILLIYLVTPSSQFVNENIKGDNNILSKKPNQIPIKNVGRLVKPIKTALKLPVKAPIQITPQPLLTRRKVQLNPTDSAKPQGLINNNKTPNSAKVDEPKPKQDLVENKDCTPNVDLEPKTGEHEKKSMFSEEIEDIQYKLEKNKAHEPKQVRTDFKAETHEDISENTLEENTRHDEPENKVVVACIDQKTQSQEKKEESDNTTQHLSSEDELKDDDDVPIDIHKEYKKSLNKLKNCSSSVEINPPHKKKVLKITDLPLKGDNYVETKKSSVHTKKYEQSKKKHLYQDNVPSVTKVEITLSPKEMEKLTNDANDKILIKKLDFEELHEKYDPESCIDDKNEPNDSPYAPDTTFIKEPYKYPLEEQINIDEICGNPITNRRFPSVANKSLREIIWRAWKNSEIHIKSDNNFKNKQKNFKMSPSNYGAYTTKPYQDIKPNNIEEVISVDGNVEFETGKYGKYKPTESQVPDGKKYFDDYSTVKFEPVDETYNLRADQSNRITNLNDVTRFIDYNRATFRPPSYGTYGSRVNYGNRPRNFDDVKRYFSGYDLAQFEPFRFEPYNTVPQRDTWREMAPAKSGIRYYSPNEYLTPPISNCYYPQSYGNQYAPVSRYQKYLFPCM